MNFRTEWPTTRLAYASNQLAELMFSCVDIIAPDSRAGQCQRSERTSGHGKGKAGILEMCARTCARVFFRACVKVEKMQEVPHLSW